MESTIQRITIVLLKWNLILNQNDESLHERRDHPIDMETGRNSAQIKYCVLNNYYELIIDEFVIFRKKGRCHNMQ
jgi:hypothetical protein